MAFAALLSPRLRSAHYKHFLSETISTANSLRRRTSRSQVHSALSSDSSKWRSSSNVHSTVHHFSSPSDLLEFSPHAAGDVDHFRVFPGFITSEEEQGVVKEITRALRGKKYQYDHWDRAIEGYRETEKTQWSDCSTALIERLRRETALATATPEDEGLETLQEIHVLDLAADGEIKPHVDSIKFCGEVIAGVSLLSSCVMRMEHEEDSGKWIHVLLPRRSLYIMSGSVRLNYTHAIPKGEESTFKGKEIVRERRLSIICRTTPK